MNPNRKLNFVIIVFIVIVVFVIVVLRDCSTKSEYTSNYTLLDNVLKCNNLERKIVSGDGNCCFMSVARGLKEVIEQKHENDPFIVHLKSTELKLDS